MLDAFGRVARRALLLAALACAPQAARAEPLEHRVAAGETLSAIAARHGLPLAQVLAQNPGLDPDRLREGQRLVIDNGRERVRVPIERGDTLRAIAGRHGVTVAQVLSWNPGVQADRIRVGQELTLYPSAPPKRSESIGTPASGQLVNARRLPPGAGYAVREPERAWGTDETVSAVVAAFARARSEHPGAPRLWVHDLSLRRGGRIDEHRSHQSGRDVDIAYPQRQCPERLCGFRRLGPGEIDAALAWTLLHYWLERDLLEAVFIDYRLQAPLYREARARGASAADLVRWFQYPRGRSASGGVIRHYRKHADHMHVRFGCDRRDAACKTLRPSLMHATR